MLVRRRRRKRKLKRNKLKKYLENPETRSTFAS